MQGSGRKTGIQRTHDTQTSPCSSANIPVSRRQLQPLELGPGGPHSPQLGPPEAVGVGPAFEDACQRQEEEAGEEVGEEGKEVLGPPVLNGPHAVVVFDHPLVGRYVARAPRSWSDNVTVRPNVVALTMTLASSSRSRQGGCVVV